MILVKKKEGRRTEETRKKNKKEERKERVFLQQTLVCNNCPTIFAVSFIINRYTTFFRLRMCRVTFA